MAEDDHLLQVKDGLTKIIPLVSVTLGLISVIARLALPQLPKMRPIAIVLIVFFGLFAIAVIAQLVLYWTGLKGREERRQFLGSLVYGVFLFLLMVAGMFARYFWELLQGGKDWTEANITALLRPLLVSLMVFYPLWSIASGAPRNFFSIVAAFQNGFFWQTVFSSLKPFGGH